MFEKSLRYGNELTWISRMFSMRQFLGKSPLKIAFFAHLY